MSTVQRNRGAQTGSVRGATVVRLDADAHKRRRARREYDRLVDEAFAELLALKAGDVGAVYGAHRILSRLVSLILTHKLDVA